MAQVKYILIFSTLVGLIIRLSLSAISFHPDVQHFDLAGYVIGQGNILNFYDYTSSLSSGNPIVKNYPVEVFNYPPSVYLSLGTLAWFLTSPINSSFHNDFLFNFSKTLGNPQLYLHLFLLKIPYLIFDFLSAILLYKFFVSKKNKILAYTFWIFNPINLYTTYMIGQFDIIPTFFVLLSLYLISKDEHRISLKKLILAVISLGIGASFKIYPLLLIFPTALVVKGLKNRILLLIFGSLFYLLPALPFLSSKGFRTSALVANQTLKSFYSQIPVSGGESIILFLAALCFFYLIFIYQKISPKFLWQRFFIILLLFFIFTHYHPQWFIWLTPFLIIELIESNFEHVFVTLLTLISFVGLLFFFDPSLTLGLFTPISPQLYKSASLWQLLHLNIDYNFARSVLHTLFASSAVYFIYSYFPKKVNS